MERFRQRYGIALTKKKLQEIILMLMAWEAVFRELSDRHWFNVHESTVFPLSHKSSVTSPPSLNTGKFKPIRFSGYSDSSFL